MTQLAHNLGEALTKLSISTETTSGVFVVPVTALENLCICARQDGLSVEILAMGNGQATLRFIKDIGEVPTLHKINIATGGIDFVARSAGAIPIFF